MIPEHDFWEAEWEGRKAPLDTECPHSITQIGKRCAWMAGYYDTRTQKLEREARTAERKKR